VAGWVEAGREARAAGEGLLFVNLDAEGEVAGYSRITVWPDLASGELGGAMRADRQGQGQGAAGAMRAFEWMFETLGLRLIGMTAAPDDVRSARLIEAAGFTRMGERESRRPDGAVQPPLYWEMARDAWRAWAGGRS
jgi:RimJ/RimL family protein N-acetyltransferase